MYQDLHEKAKEMHAYKFCNTGRPLYLETNAYGISLGTRVLWVRDGMNCWHDEISDNAIL